MDSGIETGNDSNDSSVTPHDNIAAVASIRTCALAQPNSVVINNAENNTFGMEASSDTTTSSESTSQNKLLHEPGVSETLQSSPSNSLISVNSLSTRPIMPLALVPVNEKLNSMTLEFRMPPACPSRSLDYKIPCPRRFRNSVNGLVYRESFKSVMKERKMRLAAATNNIDMMQMLIDSGISPNVYDDQGRTPLHLAACRGYTEMVSLLLKHGANPNSRDCIGNTPLHLAAVTSKISVVTLLLMAGTDVLSSDCHGYNPLQLAQTKLRVLQNCKSADMNSIKDEVRNVIGMLLAYLQKQKDASDQVEALSTFCSRLSLSNNSNQIQDDVKSLLANIDSLSLTN